MRLKLMPQMNFCTIVYLWGRRGASIYENLLKCHGLKFPMGIESLRKYHSIAVLQDMLIFSCKPLWVFLCLELCKEIKLLALNPYH